jgi:hypothetical protein
MRLRELRKAELPGEKKDKVFHSVILVGDEIF